MQRVFVPGECFGDGEAIVRGSARRHLADALRVRAGERFLATDGDGFEYVLEARAVGKRELVCAVVERARKDEGVSPRVTLAIAPPRGSRMDAAIEKCVECGVGRIVPMITQRSVLRGRDDSERAERWLRVARSATAQSGRVTTPGLAPVTPFPDALREAASGLALLAHPGPDARGVTAVLAGTARTDPVTVLVGPEGGFTDEEVAEASRAGATGVSLGPTRLRSETAAIVAVALVLDALRGREP